jgi:hypothetical protein
LKTICEDRRLPLRADEIDLTKPFDATELLYRRVSKGGVNPAGELLPSELDTFSFDKSIDSAPSVLRSAFCGPTDVLAVECSAGKDVSNWLVFAIAVGELPTPIEAGDGRSFEIYPVHRPLPLCGAHSVIASGVGRGNMRAYTPPPRSVKNALRTKLATRFKLVTPAGQSGSKAIGQ